MTGYRYANNQDHVDKRMAMLLILCSARVKIDAEILFSENLIHAQHSSTMMHAVWSERNRLPAIVLHLESLRCMN